jgi:hypothetical protein
MNNSKPFSHYFYLKSNDFKRAIDMIHLASSPGYTEGIFFVPTKMGGLRPVINHYVSKTYYWFMVPYYKMEAN